METGQRQQTAAPRSSPSASDSDSDSLEASFVPTPLVPPMDDPTEDVELVSPVVGRCALDDCRSSCVNKLPRLKRIVPSPCWTQERANDGFAGDPHGSKAESAAAKKDAKKRGISLAEILSRSLRTFLSADESKPWMKLAGMVGSGDPNSSQKIDEL